MIRFATLAQKGLIAVSLLLASTLASTAVAQDHKPVLHALTDSNLVPFEMMNRETGEMEGFDIDILKAVAKRAGFDYKLTIMSFPGIIPALQTGSADLAITGITITKARAKIVDFSDPYYQAGLRILVHANDTDIKTLDDLKGHSVATQIGTTSYKYLHDHLGDSIDLKPYPQTTSMYMAVMSGAADALVYDGSNVAYFAKTKGKNRVKVVGPSYLAQPYGIAFVKGSKWVTPVNKALHDMKADGSYAAIYKKWFGKLPPKKDLAD